MDVDRRHRQLNAQPGHVRSARPPTQMSDSDGNLGGVWTVGGRLHMIDFAQGCADYRMRFGMRKRARVKAHPLMERGRPC